MSTQNIWIIGASSGIGRALAKRYADKGWRVFASARSEAGLVSLVSESSGSTGEVVALPVDITSDAALGEVGRQLFAFPGHLQKAIINAGTCEYVDSVPVDMSLLRRVMETNFFGAVQAANTALPLLENSVRSGLGGQLAFVSSSVTYQALPRAEAYGASKAALRYFAECIKADFQYTGIDFRVVSPGFVKTPLTDKNDFPMPELMEADDAAKEIFAGLDRSEFDIHFPKRFTRGLKFLSLLPDRLRFHLLGKMSRQSGEPSSELP